MAVVRVLGNLSEVSDLLRTGADDWITAAGVDIDPTRLEQLLLETTLALASEQGREQFGRRTMLLETLAMEYSVSMDLLRSQQRDPTTLGWLERTAGEGGVLALFENGRRADHPARYL